MTDLKTLETHLRSGKKDARLKALGLILRHPHASPLQLVQCLCSSDNRNFEFLEVFGMGESMRAAWSRIKEIDDDMVYSYLQELQNQNPREHREHVQHILEKIGTPRAKAMLAIVSSRK